MSVSKRLQYCLNNIFMKTARPAMRVSDEEWEEVKRSLPDWAKDHNEWEKAFLSKFAESNLAQIFTYQPGAKVKVGIKEVEDIAIVNSGTNNALQLRMERGNPLFQFVVTNFYAPILELLGQGSRQMRIWNNKFSSRELFGTTPEAFVRKHLHMLVNAAREAAADPLVPASVTLEDAYRNNENNLKPLIIQTINDEIPVDVLNNIYIEDEADPADLVQFSTIYLSNEEIRDGIVNAICENIPEIKPDTITNKLLIKILTDILRDEYYNGRDTTRRVTRTQLNLPPLSATDSESSNISAEDIEDVEEIEEDISNESVWWDSEDDINDRIKQEIEKLKNEGMIKFGSPDATEYQMGNHVVSNIWLNGTTGNLFVRNKVLNVLYNEIREARPDEYRFISNDINLYSKGYERVRNVLRDMGATILN